MSALQTIPFSHNLTIAAYNEAQTTLSHWGVGGDYSRALSVVTNIVVGSTAGQGTTQLASNALAPYAAELIGNTFAHTDNPSQAAQLLSHAVLGGVLAYVNGGNAASGAVAGAGAEAAALSIAKELYPNAFVNGVLDRSKLTEAQANGIVALSSGIGALIGGISGGGITGATIDANVAQNAVENNSIAKIVVTMNKFDGKTNLGTAKVYLDGEKNPRSILITSGRNTSDMTKKYDPNTDIAGPTPEGTYIIDPNKSQNMSLIDRLFGVNQGNNELSSLNLIRKYATGDWGDFRAPLEPINTTNTFNRTDMYLHGGSFTGSAGCIDCGSTYDSWLLNELRDTNHIIPVEVKYGK